MARYTTFPKKLCLTSLIAGGAALAWLALAPDRATAQTETPRRGGTLIVARQADITQWDPKFTNDTVSIQAQHQIYATLMQNSTNGRELRAWLAESYELSPDSRIYTFRLRANAKFCDGTPITADDVKFSIERAMEW
jgi:ABC-type transport system substrate-binding protein